MDKTGLKNILSGQAATFEFDFKHKLEVLQKGEACFTDVSSYLIKAEDKSEQISFEDAFREVGGQIESSLRTQPSKPQVSVMPNNISQRVVQVQENRQKLSVVSGSTAAVARSGLSSKIAALRGCPAPGDYLFK